MTESRSLPNYVVVVKTYGELGQYAALPLVRLDDEDAVFHRGSPFGPLNVWLFRSGKKCIKPP